MNAPSGWTWRVAHADEGLAHLYALDELQAGREAREVTAVCRSADSTVRVDQLHRNERAPAILRCRLCERSASMGAARRVFDAG